jgi:hypothetical protein
MPLQVVDLFCGVGGLTRFSASSLETSRLMGFSTKRPPTRIGRPRSSAISINDLYADLPRLFFFRFLSGVGRNMASNVITWTAVGFCGINSFYLPSKRSCVEKRILT